MSVDIEAFLTKHKKLIENEKTRLGTQNTTAVPATDRNDEEKDAGGGCYGASDEKENEVPVTSVQNAPLIETLDLSCVPNEKPCRSDVGGMLRYGEYSPNNPQLRVNAAPYLGLGEYEQRKRLLLDRRKEHVNNIQYTPTNPKFKTAEEDLVITATGSPTIHNRNSVMHNNRSPVLHRLDQRITAAHNSLLKSEMDKPRGILTNRRTESPRERLLSDLKHSYVPPSSLLDGFSYTDRADDLERERIKREIYQNELRLQIEEKRRLAAMREEQERREQELENRRLEQQLLRMQEEQLRDEQRRKRREQIRRNSDDYISRKQELQSRGYRKHTDSESSTTNLRSTTAVSSQKLSHYSPPVSRRNPYSFNVPTSSSCAYSDPSTRYNPSRYESFVRNRMDSLNVPPTADSYSSLNYGRQQNSFSRYDSLSRIDSLKQQEALSRLEALSISDSLNRVQRRHSATQQDLSMIRRSPKLQRRSSSSRFDDSLPVPVLKARSPVARELKNSIAVNSTRHSSDAVRRLEDKWQIPAVQKNIINHGEHSDGQSRSILTQLGAIRMQLQREQLRMDETLRKRGITQSKSVDFH